MTGTLQIRAPHIHESECWLTKHPEWAGCCCRCKYRLRLQDHDGFPAGRVLRGWVCIAFSQCEGEPVAYLGDFEHGLCELYEGLSKPVPTGGQTPDQRGRHARIQQRRGGKIELSRKGEQNG